MQSRPAAPSNGGGKYESSDDDSVVEDMMDAMLEAELKGIGDFEDDFVADGDVDDVADIFSDEDGADDSPPARKVCHLLQWHVCANLRFCLSQSDCSFIGAARSRQSRAPFRRSDIPHFTAPLAPQKPSRRRGRRRVQAQ